MSQVVGLPNNSYKTITNTAWVRARLCKLQKECIRLAAASDQVYQLLAHGRWFSPGTPASSTTKTGRHDIAEILLKVALKHQKQKNQQSLGEALKTMNTIKFGRDVTCRIIRSCTNDATQLKMCTQIWQQRHQLKFLIISPELNPDEQFRIL